MDTVRHLLANLYTKLNYFFLFFIECLPHLSINSCLEHIAIAKPYKKKEIEEEEGFWEIKEKQTELSKNEGQSGPQKLKKQRVWITPNVVIS